MSNEILKSNGNVPAIAKDKLDAIAALSETQIPQLKPVESGFRVKGSETFVKEIRGTIIDVSPYLIRFENNIAHKLPHVADDLDIPPGYDRRCDLRILVDDQVIGLSLSPTSMRHQLSPYIKYLRGKGLELHRVTSRLTSQQVSTSKATWSKVIFEHVEDPAPKISPEPPQAATQPQDRIPQRWK